MGLFTKTRTYSYHIYSPVMGDSYDTTIKYGNRKEKVPLDVITTRQMLVLHGQGLNNSSNMKAQLKNLREIHNLPFLKKTESFGTQKIETKIVDFKKLENVYNSTIQDISSDVSSALACEYIYKVSKGKYSSIYDIEDIILNDIIPKIDTISKESLKLTRLKPGRKPPKFDISDIKVVKLKDLSMSYIGNNTFSVSAQVSVLEDRNDREQGRIIALNTRDYDFILTLPEEFLYLWDIANNPNIYLVKFTNGNIIYLDANALANFQKQGDNKVEFSTPIALKLKYMSYSDKEAKRMEIARTKLGYQEHKNKKRNRQELLYEAVQNNKDIDHDCRINMYLDLYPFKDPKYRADKNWQLFLKGVMKYFARITNISQVSEGKGFTSVSIPPYFLTSEQTFRYMNIEIIKEKISNVDINNPSSLCFFEIDRPRDKLKIKVSKGKAVTENLNTLWLCLIVNIGNNKFIKYKLNYTRFYEGLNGIDSSDKLIETHKIFSSINKKLESRMPKAMPVDENEGGEKSFIRHLKILELIRLKDAFWYSDKDISMAKWDKDANKMKDKIPTGVPENGLKAFKAPRLPMPILMWNMIPYNGKKVAYTSTLLINFLLEVRVKESTGLGEFVAVVVAAFVTFVTWNPGAGAKAGAATSAALIGVSSALVTKVIITVGVWAAAIGSITGNKFLSNIGMAIGLWGGISSIVNAFNGGLSSLSALQKISLGLNSVNFVIDVANKIRGLDMEKKLRSLADELKNGQKEFEYEKDNRRDIWGGVAKTNASADEEIDQMLELVLQEGLFEVLVSHIDIEKNSGVFNSMKYDNVR